LQCSAPAALAVFQFRDPQPPVGRIGMFFSKCERETIGFSAESARQIFIGGTCRSASAAPSACPRLGQRAGQFKASLAHFFYAKFSMDLTSEIGGDKMLVAFAGQMRERSEGGRKFWMRSESRFSGV